MTECLRWLEIMKWPPLSLALSLVTRCHSRELWWKCSFLGWAPLSTYKFQTSHFTSLRITGLKLWHHLGFLTGFILSSFTNIVRRRSKDTLSSYIITFDLPQNKLLIMFTIKLWRNSFHTKNPIPIMVMISQIIKHQKSCSVFRILSFWVCDLCVNEWRVM